LFLVVPIGGLLVALHGRLPRWAWPTAAFTTLVALAYTAPWDNALIRNGVWSFGPGHVVGVVLGVVPLEEYVFYILQVVFTGLFTIWLLQRQITRMR
jgi:lycopene cyclase domain-containing protein